MSDFLTHRYQFTHAGYGVVPFGHCLFGAKQFTGAAHIGRAGGTVSKTFTFPEQQFDSEAAARNYAEQRARELIDSGELDAQSA